VPTIDHVFVLTLENRSFDHMLGFSRITGKDAVTGQPTTIEGLRGTEANGFNGKSFAVANTAELAMNVGPHHEFDDVLMQLCGERAVYPPDGPYPPIDNSGFVADYLSHKPGLLERLVNLLTLRGNPDGADVMRCFDPTTVPVIAALAKEFAVCDHWFSSMPGPTWPNRFFLLGASSDALDDSPKTLQMLAWETLDGFKLEHGSIFDQQISWRIYAGGDLCFAHALKGIHLWDIHSFAKFAGDLHGNYPYHFTLIEPNYGHVVSDYRGGTSEHPLDNVASGEGFIKAAYEAIRNSPVWESSLLIVTWDEHGGFYDHVAPPAARPPGDLHQHPKLGRHKFKFDQLGPRVPAVVISPLIPQGLIDHRTYDHSSVLTTAEKAFGLKPLTWRDATAGSLLGLASLPAPRDTPAVLPSPGRPREATMAMDAAQMQLPGPPPTRPDEPVESDPNLPGFTVLAMRNDRDLSGQERSADILARCETIRTRRDAHAYIEQVRPRIRNARAERGL
jgi:phospholipase C